MRIRKHNQVHTLGVPHYKTHFLFKKIEGFECALKGPKNTVI